MDSRDKVELASAHWWNSAAACGHGFVDPGDDVSDVVFACAYHFLPSLIELRSAEMEYANLDAVELTWRLIKSRSQRDMHTTMTCFRKHLDINGTFTAREIWEYVVIVWVAFFVSYYIFAKL
jgi:hypothetical protein